MKKRLIALLMCAIMVMGGATTVLATEQTEAGSAQDSNATVMAPIYSYDISNVVVPTTIKVAFNPNGHTVTMSDGAGSTTTTTDQIVSLNYGILNKSSKNKLLTVDFTVTDNNVVDEKGIITFASKADEVTAAKKGDYVVHLQVVPGEVTTTIDHQTEAAALADVAMTDDATKALSLPGSGKMGFTLQNAVYDQGDIVLGTDGENDVAEKFTLSGVNSDSYIGFTFAGTMNTNTNWSGLANGIEVKAVYGWETTDSTTYGVTELTKAPTFTSDAYGTINYDPGFGEDALASITSIIMTNNAKDYDGYKAYGENWTNAVDDGTKVTFDSKFTAYFNANATTKATITYVTVGGGTKTANVDVVTQVAE